MDVSFPRTEYSWLDPYSDPKNRPHARLLWAARDASTEWTRVMVEQDWKALDHVTIRLAVFDKAYAINAAQWPHRHYEQLRHWRYETNQYASRAFLFAALALAKVGQRHRLPVRSEVLTFCRQALDVCAEPLVDGYVYDRSLLEKVPPPPGVHGDHIGVAIAQYDPIVRHQALLAEEPLYSHAVEFIYDSKKRAYVLDPNADEIIGN
ncbi:hypothetical protein CspHIS471_0600030 [Cutaneotrichosporon sp. HIS471]|nr:hypothetical protein CspHIS471_0600030 [Cutaneotrichosporon sp. HIS471]